MKRILVVVFSVFLLQVVTASADEHPVQATADQQTCEELRAADAPAEQLAKRGCCSWHGGVCGCSGGRVVCCDGMFSPSCLCNSDDPKNVVN